MWDRKAPVRAAPGLLPGGAARLQLSKPLHVPFLSKSRSARQPPGLLSRVDSAASVLLAKGLRAPLSPLGPLLRGLTSTGGWAVSWASSQPRLAGDPEGRPGALSNPLPRSWTCSFFLTMFFPCSYLVTCHLPIRNVLLTPAAPSPTDFLF